MTGQNYTLQIFEAFWNNNWATSFSDGLDSSANVNLSGPDQGAGASTTPQYLVGTFVADSATKILTLNGPTAYVIFDAVQLRATDALNAEAAVPEPASGLLLLGAVGVALRSRRGRTPV